jgi:hypothetical protein
MPAISPVLLEEALLEVTVWDALGNALDDDSPEVNDSVEDGTIDEYGSSAVAERTALAEADVATAAVVAFEVVEGASVDKVVVLATVVAFSVVFAGVAVVAGALVVVSFAVGSGSLVFEESLVGSAAALIMRSSWLKRWVFSLETTIMERNVWGSERKQLKREEKYIVKL